MIGVIGLLTAFVVGCYGSDNGWSLPRTLATSVLAAILAIRVIR